MLDLAAFSVHLELESRMNTVFLACIEGQHGALYLEHLAGDLREAVDELIDQSRDRRGRNAGRASPRYRRPRCDLVLREADGGGEG